MYCKRSRFQAQQGDCPFYPPCRGVAPGLGHPGDNVHSIVIVYNILYVYVYFWKRFRMKVHRALFTLCLCTNLHIHAYTSNPNLDCKLQ